ncbi:alpha/beta hydrolase [Nocardioides zeae]
MTGPPGRRELTHGARRRHHRLPRPGRGRRRARPRRDDAGGGPGRQPGLRRPLRSRPRRRLGGGARPDRRRRHRPPRAAPRARGHPRGVVVYLHGGGWVVDDIDGYDCLGRTLAVRSGWAVLLVDYRKAPEDPYPAAVHDAWAGLLEGDRRRAALATAAGGDLPLAVAGDSAGGNLAAVVAQQAARDGGPRLDLQALVYPVTDHDTATASYTDPANALMLTRAAMEHFWSLYVPDEARRAEPAASPLRATDLARLDGLAPALVLLPEHDVLRDEGEAYAAALAAAGVPVDLQVAPGQMHGFFQFVNVLPGAADGMATVVAALDRAATRA